jgi:trans-2,3-dihydro-3-hydroxyanthranilate isomerase
MTATRRYQFQQLDVFAAQPLEGNPLAVFTDARGLSDGEMQALAREMNLSETTYIFPANGARSNSTGGEQAGTPVRIFTVKEELPFAGHPTLGTAFVLRGGSGAGQVTLDLPVGKIPVRFEDPAGEPSFGEMRQHDPEFGAVHDRGEVARAVGLAAGDLDSDLPVQTVSTGVPFTVVPVKTLASVRGLHFDYGGAAEYLERSGGRFFYFVCRETEDPRAHLHARMIFYNGDDPATGSAAGCACAWMVAQGVAREGERVLIEQGLEAGRPSRIFVRGQRDESGLHVYVGGNAVLIARGEVLL